MGVVRWQIAAGRSCEPTHVPSADALANQDMRMGWDEVMEGTHGFSTSPLATMVLETSATHKQRGVAIKEVLPWGPQE